MATVEAASSKGNRPRGTIPLPAATPDTPQDRASQGAKGLKGLKKLVEPLEPLTPRRRRSTRAKNRRKVLRAKSRRKLLPLNEVSDETIEWLFPNLIPLGNITILDGKGRGEVHADLRSGSANHLRQPHALLRRPLDHRGRDPAASRR